LFSYRCDYSEFRWTAFGGKTPAPRPNLANDPRRPERVLEYRADQEVRPTDPRHNDEMEQVTCLGGLLFRVRAPETLVGWYRDHLRITPVPANYDEQPWLQEAGPTAFAPFPEGTDYFGPDPAKGWMVNFRIRNLDAIVAELRAAGAQVEIDRQPYPHGWFARLCDPEGNPIELCEPGGPEYRS
jgi:glyoxylase I family protein